MSGTKGVEDNTHQSGNSKAMTKDLLGLPKRATSLSFRGSLQADCHLCLFHCRLGNPLLRFSPTVDTVLSKNKPESCRPPDEEQFVTTCGRLLSTKQKQLLSSSRKLCLI